MQLRSVLSLRRFIYAESHPLLRIAQSGEFVLKYTFTYTRQWRVHTLQVDACIRKPSFFSKNSRRACTCRIKRSVFIRRKLSRVYGRFSGRWVRRERKRGVKREGGFYPRRRAKSLSPIFPPPPSVPISPAALLLPLPFTSASFLGLIYETTNNVQHSDFFLPSRPNWETFV